MDHNLPEYEEWNNAAVHLLRGAVYYNNEYLWNTILANRIKLKDYFAHLGLSMVITEEDGMVYLRPLKEQEQPEGYEGLPKLFHKTYLNYEQTILCVLLRERLGEFETEEVDDEHCAFDRDSVFEQWKAFGFTARDEVALNNKYKQCLSKLEKIGFISKIKGEERLWKVNSILKARLSADKLEKLRLDLQQEIKRRTSVSGEDSNE